MCCGHLSGELPARGSIRGRYSIGDWAWSSDHHRSLSALSFEARGSVVAHEANMLVPETIIIHVIGCTLRAEGLVGVLSDEWIYHGDGGKSS